MLRHLFVCALYERFTCLHQVVAIAMFIKGEGGFLDRELYPFCFRIADGKTLASPKAVPAGTDVRTLKDAIGNT
jgi:hypothetical protein